MKQKETNITNIQILTEAPLEQLLSDDDIELLVDDWKCSDDVYSFSNEHIDFIDKLLDNSNKE
jgi:hypothetical protein